MGFEWSGAVPTAISWGLTFSAVCVGYIFFRAESIRQAVAMLKGWLRRTYLHRTFDHSFYVMTLVAAVGYFAVIGGTVLLDRLGEAASRRQETAPGALSSCSAS